MGRVVGMMRRKYQLGENLRIVSETSEDVRLEGSSWLRPGQLVQLVLGGEGLVPAVSRDAYVHSWAVARIAANGPVYEGLCRWCEPGSSMMPIAPPEAKATGVARDGGRLKKVFGFR